ncbi:ferritin [Fulvitalea axinellae]
MKDLLTQTRSLAIGVENALNKQVIMEAESSAVYLAMASWCMRNGYEKARDFFMAQADEEREHMKKIFRYVDDMGGQASPGHVGKVKEDFDSFRHVFECMLDQEIAVSKSINNIVALAYEEKDFSTVQYLQWFVEEQREEVYVARQIVKLFDLVNIDGGISVFDIEDKLGSIEYKEG